MAHCGAAGASAILRRTGAFDAFGRLRSNREQQAGTMPEYQGYLIKLNPKTGRWEVFWKDRKQEVDFATEAEAEEWIDDLFPSHRF
jgi:hypothetical protein